MDSRLPPENSEGLYDARFEHDACGIGFVVDIKGRQRPSIVRQALTLLANLDHRGARGAEPDTGDGAGILLQLPDRFLRQVCADVGFALPPAGQYGAGMIFLPTDEDQRAACIARFEKIVAAEGLRVLGWRSVPTANATLGTAARMSEPHVAQIFVDGCGLESEALAWRLFVIRRQVEQAIRRSQLAEARTFYIASLSHKTIVYKGMLTPAQLSAYYPDLSHPEMASALALVHSRFSTNTFPSWQRAHPNRYLIHNGEINTLRGNVNWMRARESAFAQAAADPTLGPDLEKVLPIIDERGSDSAMFDNCLEFLVLTGRSLPHAMMMMIPEPWSLHENMSDQKRAFYEYHSCLMEPWDGPASIAFTDGVRVGAVLDRNGLRPSRYLVTTDDLVVLASEAGVLSFPPEQIQRKARLQPGRMLLVDTERGEIIADETLKREVAGAHPYRAWLNQHLLPLESLPDPPTVTPEPQAGRPLNGNGSTPGALPREAGAEATLVSQQQAFGYTYEDLRLIMAPMVSDGVEPLGSMGDDTPLAVLSNHSPLLYDYFKQLFAQVTNPPLDAIREALVTGTEMMLGSEGDLLRPKAADCRRIRLPAPVLLDEALTRLREVNVAGFQSATLSLLFAPDGGSAGLEEALARLFAEADAALSAGANLLILSDRGVDVHHAAIPALLATAGLHHHLLRQGTRTRASLLVESGEPREVHHIATLVGYGADAVNPYLALATIRHLLQRQLLPPQPVATAQQKYAKALTKGIVKVISKMGISTLQSYHGAQIFEALGLHPEVVDRYFTGTPSRIGGADLETIAADLLRRHRHAFAPRPANGSTLPEGGRYQWRQGGEYHLFNPLTVHRLQHAVRSDDYEAYRAYAQAVDDQSRQHCTLRGLLDLIPAAEPLSLAEVEPVEAIMRRFKTGAMSYGSISQEAHEALALAMNRIGGKSNTGEGGEDPARYRPAADGDSRNSAIKQVASGRFGVTSEYLVNAQEIQIKIAQGAKPGEGGQLPGHKVYPWIARVRHSTPGVGLISPPPHHDIYSIEDLAQLIYDLKNANPEARISVKLVSEVGVGTIAAGVAKGHADVILISGADGGTGASPRGSIKHAGLPWELGLAETHQTLLFNHLRGRVTLETDGQLRTGRDVAIAALLGAEEFGFATAPLVALGCIMMRVCHLDTCPVGVATQNPDLRRNFAGDPQHVVNFMTFVARDLREWMARLGFRTVEEMVGRSDRLQPRPEAAAQGRGLDYSRILYRPPVPPEVPRTASEPQAHGLEQALDNRYLLERCRPALESRRPVRLRLPIRNVNRTVGTMLGSEITRRYGAAGLPPDTIRLRFHGSAGQSFGAFIPSGLTMIVEGETNDYLGKGLSGGRIVVVPPAGSAFDPEENVIVGNVAFYGATAGEAYIYGVAGERFCVRNSGLHAVVEAVGDHGCEYMTGGRVVILGETGRNFAAGMSGGIAYVFDPDGNFPGRCNQEMVDLEPLGPGEESTIVKQMIRRHAIHTGSRKARRLLKQWQRARSHFVRVIPRDYRRVLASIATAGGGDEAVMAAFRANKEDLARVGGN